LVAFGLSAGVLAAGPVQPVYSSQPEGSATKPAPENCGGYATALKDPTELGRKWRIALEPIESPGDWGSRATTGEFSPSKPPLGSKP
jgi:hypothetical protein